MATKAKGTEKPTDVTTTNTAAGADKKPKKKSSAIAAAAKGRSAVNAVIADAAGAVRGHNGLANTGPVTSYENED